MDTEKDLNRLIVQMTMTIQTKYPELSKYLEEVKATIPSEKSPDITREDLKVYYNSLNDLFTKYKLTHPDDSILQE